MSKCDALVLAEEGFDVHLFEVEGYLDLFLRKSF
jgi:hypothetical protein